MSRKKTKQPSKPRNRFACDPIMAKAGFHEKSVKAKRKLNKQKLRKELFSFLLYWFEKASFRPS